MKEALLLFLVLFSGIKPIKAQANEIFSEKFKNQRLKQWEKVNGSWEVNREEKTVTAHRNSNWALLTSKKQLPENYILTFTTKVDSTAYLFEVILNLQQEKFLGILYNQLESKVAIEDRSLLPAPDYVRTTGNIGKLPKVKIPMPNKWLDWKIQKAGNQFFVWVNNEAIIKFEDTTGIVKNKGRFGFAVNGSAVIKNIKLIKTKKEAALPPEDFIGKPYEKPFFLFSE